MITVTPSPTCPDSRRSSWAHGTAGLVGFRAVPEQGKELLSSQQAQGCSSRPPFPCEQRGEGWGSPGCSQWAPLRSQLREDFKLRNARALVSAEGAEKWESALPFPGLQRRGPPKSRPQGQHQPPSLGGGDGCSPGSPAQ